MSQKHITLTEYSFVYLKKDDKDDNKNAIKADQFDSLEKFVLENSDSAYFLKPAYKKGYGKILQAQNYVGIIQLKDGTTIEILPKIAKVEEEKEEEESKEKKSKEILIKMLKTLKKSPFKHFNTADLKSANMPLLEIFITMFLDELSDLVRKGIRSDYITKEENLKFLKGKLKISQQIKKNFIHKERFFVEYQEFLSDRVENRLIKTTLSMLYKLSKHNRNQQRIREFLFVFEEIGLSHNIKNDFAKVKLDRQMKYYEDILLWCRIFLLKNSFTPYKGEDIAFALLFDMNVLFESYVGNFLRKKGFNVSLQDSGKHLVEGPRKKYALRPDIVIDDGNSIADTKWKIINKNNSTSQNDMYQMFAYGKKYEKCKKLYLIYPYNEGCDKEIKKYKFYENGELDLKVCFFNLSNDNLTTLD